MVYTKKREGTPLPRPQQEWSQVREDSKNPKAFWFATDAIGSGLQQEMLTYVTRSTLVKALLMISTEKKTGRKLCDQIFGILANCYKHPQSMCNEMKKYGIPPLGSWNKWTSAFVLTLRKNSDLRVN